MSSPSAPLLVLDPQSFNPWRIAEVCHHLSEHPLFARPALMALAQRLEQRGSIRSHGNGAQAGTAFNHAPVIFPNQQSAVATLGDLEHAKAWMSLLNVQTDEVYRRLVDEVLEDVKPMVDTRDPGMSYRGGWIFVSSPHTVTPFHIDKEHNFILQISGRKTLYVWEPDDVEAVSEEARDLFHSTHSRDLIAWRELLRQRARVFHLEPGMGAYMPSTSPHMVECGEDASVTASFTYYTDATRRNSVLHQMHQSAREMGLKPAAVGQSPIFDALGYAAYRFASGVKQLSRSRREVDRAGMARYAQAAAG